MATTSPSRARKIAIRLSAMLNGFLAEKLDDEALVKHLRKLALDIEGDAVLKPCKPPALLENLSMVQAVFAHWQRRMTKPRARLTVGRATAIKARAREGYTEQQMKRAIDACAASEFHMGENDRKVPYNDLTLILRNGEKLEHFLELSTTQNPDVNESTEIQRLQREAADALNRGDTDAYNSTNALIRAARASAG
jgi:hypothetical protein